jgi:hypothetical protein
MIFYTVLCRDYLLMEREYREHDKKINGNQQELDYLMPNFMRKIARHDVTVYSDCAGGLPDSGWQVSGFRA